MCGVLSENLKRLMTNMKKLALLIIGFAALAARADLMLYWTVDLSDPEAESLNNAISSFYNGGTYSDALYAMIKGKGSGDAALLDTIAVGSKVDTNITGWDSSFKNYIIEIYNSSDLVAYSDVFSYDQLVAGSATWETDTLGMKATAPKNFGALGFRATPEPTSGLLILVGLAGLALKRRRA